MEAAGGATTAEREGEDEVEGVTPPVVEGWAGDGEAAAVDSPATGVERAGNCEVSRASAGAAADGDAEPALAPAAEPPLLPLASPVESAAAEDPPAGFFFFFANPGELPSGLLDGWMTVNGEADAVDAVGSAIEVTAEEGEEEEGG